MSSKTVKTIVFDAKPNEKGLHLIGAITDVMDRTAELEVDTAAHSDTMALIDGTFEFPQLISGKLTSLWWNPKTKLIEIEVREPGFDDLTSTEKIEFLIKENAVLRAELDLTQAALFELYEGGGK
jgi:hypothetical protein